MQLQKVVALAEKIQHVFVATADGKGLPHVAAAGTLTAAPAGRLAVAAWFCPGTVTNLRQNRHVAIVVWDQEDDFGYQLLGEVEKVEEVAVMDGYIPGEDEIRPLPQIERQLIVRVDKVIAFRHAPHSDIEE